MNRLLRDIVILASLVTCVYLMIVVAPKFEFFGSILACHHIFGFASYVIYATDPVDLWSQAKKWCLSWFLASLVFLVILLVFGVFTFLFLFISWFLEEKDAIALNHR